METPFATAELLDVFGRYNQGVWPAQAGMYLLAALVLWLAWRPRPRWGMIIGAALAFFWGWMALAYHAAYFTRINPAAWLFAAVFLLQAALLLHAGVRGDLSLRPRMDAAGAAGGLLVAYALLAYPLIGYAAGQRYPATPTFGLPCPTTIFTFGVLLWAAPRIPGRLLVIPGLWALLGVSAARSHGMVQDYGLPVAALVAIAAALWSRARLPASAPRAVEAT